MSRFNDNPMMEPVFFTEPSRFTCRGERLYKGGGGSSGVKYNNLERLYQEQADSAGLLRQMAETNLPSAVADYVRTSKEFTRPEYVEKQVANAQADMGSANAKERSATERNLTSMGVNPNDPRFAGSMRATEVNNSARLAAGSNIARNEAKVMQNAVSKDMVGTFTGQSNQAAQQAGAATSGMAGLVSQQQQQQMQQQQMQQQNVSNAVAGGMALYSMFKDGGRVSAPKGIAKRADGGAISSSRVVRPRGIVKLMLGGPASNAGFLSPSSPQAPPEQPQAPQQQPQIGQAMRTGKQAGGLLSNPTQGSDKLANVLDKFGADKMADSVYSHGRGMAMGPEQSRAAADAYSAAAQNASTPELAAEYQRAADGIRNGAGISGESAGATASGEAAAGAGEALGAEAGVSAGAEAGASAGAEALGTAGAEVMAGEAGAQVAGTVIGESAALGAGSAASTATAGAGAGVAGAAGTGAGAAGAGAAAGALSTAAAAVPWIGAAVAVGSLLGAFKDGGEVKASPLVKRQGGGGIDLSQIHEYGRYGAGGLTEWLRGNDAPESGSDRALSMSGDVIGMNVFKDGGGTQAQDLRGGGGVSGPGSHTDDLVPALLSDMENVDNAEATALIGQDRLDKINKVGLRLRARGIHPDTIRGISLAARGVN